jgi:hypothetical protein
VSPILWTEMWYVHVKKISSKFKGLSPSGCRLLGRFSNDFFLTFKKTLINALPKVNIYKVWLKFVHWFIKRKWKCIKSLQTDRDQERWSGKLTWAFQNMWTRKNIIYFNIWNINTRNITKFSEKCQAFSFWRTCCFQNNYLSFLFCKQNILK